MRDYWDTVAGIAFLVLLGIVLLLLATRGFYLPTGLDR